ncbi:response regulator [Phototrophicus methaneseepsis]|uniref:Response regulator n=1 Tax=Phototrophicus methaneseepsis TaxID=2710758 RepID=A0A7S8EAA2_9CHLR|nr:response regulator [Phototrophicus methaneseepsis]QPC83240.1 response regulator [Phototrophicus methaneseepsis]
MDNVVLIVEDDAGLWPMYRYVLKDITYPLMFARTGEEAFKLLKSEQPILIFLDVRLPLMNGEDILSYIHGVPRLATTPVIITTSMREDELHIPGAYYLRKPIKPETIRDYAQRLLHISA